jgi:DNA polymerase-3 subunit epsilon
MAREIVLDTETTGLDARRGDRLIEIGCVEMINRFPTGREFHTFLNPETRDVHPDAEAVHGLSTAFLKDKPFFRDIADAFIGFIGDDPLIIHNASFDVGFLNMELELTKRPGIAFERVTDTLQLARRKHPAGPNTLDALCKRYNIDNSKRTKHGAIMDSLLLAEVYIELTGSRQASLGFGGSTGADAVGEGRRPSLRPVIPQRPRPLAERLTAKDIEAHARFVETLGAGALWKQLQEG